MATWPRSRQTCGCGVDTGPVQDLSAIGLHLDSASPHTFTPGIYKCLATPSLSVVFNAKWPPAPLLDVMREVKCTIQGGSGSCCLMRACCERSSMCVPPSPSAPLQSLGLSWLAAGNSSVLISTVASTTCLQ